VNKCYYIVKSYKVNSPIKLAEAVILLACIQKMTGSNLDKDTENDDRIFVGFVGPSGKILG
jgi:hypothetical protein